MFCNSERQKENTKLKTSEDELLFELLDEKTYAVKRQYSAFNKKYGELESQNDKCKYYIVLESNRYNASIFFHYEDITIFIQDIYHVMTQMEIKWSTEWHRHWFMDGNNFGQRDLR